MASPVLQLDPADPSDRRILTLQQKAARQAGREGRDRAASTRGRPDLEDAFDEGAGESDDQGDEDEPKRTKRQAIKQGAAATAHVAGAPARGVGWISQTRPGRYLSRGRWRPTVSPPSRMRDAGSLLTGMLLYTAVVTYLRYGPDGWKGWLSAKFLNKPMEPAQFKEDG